MSRFQQFERLRTNRDFQRGSTNTSRRHNQIRKTFSS